MVNIFVVTACTAGMVGKVASFVVKIFVLQCSTTKTTNILPHENYLLYGMVQCFANIIMRGFAKVRLRNNTYG